MIVTLVLVGIWALGVGAVFRFLTNKRRTRGVRSYFVKGSISLAWPLVYGIIFGQLLYRQVKPKTGSRLARYRALMMRVYDDDSLTVAQKRVLYKVITESGKRHIWPPAIIPIDGTSPVITLETLGFKEEIPS